MNEEKPVSANEPEKSVEDKAQTEDTASIIKNNVKTKSIWLRLFFMLVVTLFYSVSRVVVGAVVVVQFFWVLFNGETNKGLLSLGQSLSTYIFQIVRYLTFNSEERPFPFDIEWPGDEEVKSHDGDT